MRVERAESVREDGRTFIVHVDVVRVDVELHPDAHAWRAEILVRGDPKIQVGHGESALGAFDEATKAFRPDLPWEDIRRRLSDAGAFEP